MQIIPQIPQANSAGCIMSTFINSIQLRTSPAVIIPNGPQVSYKDLGSIIGHIQTAFLNPSSPLYKTATSSNSIAIALPNGLEFIAAFLAVTCSGRVAAPLNSNYKKNEFDFYLQDLQAKAVIVPKGTSKDANKEIIQAARINNTPLIEIWWSNARGRIEYEIFCEKSLESLYRSENLPTFENFSAVIPGQAHTDDVAMILHTSGTTGRPKAVPLTHANICKSMQNIVQTYDLSEKDRSYIVMPLFHVHGLIGGLLSSLMAGGSAIIPPKFSASVFWSDFDKYKANWYTAVPTIHIILLNTELPKKMPHLRFIRSCSLALAPSTFRKLEKAFKAPVIEAYAMTEASHQMCSNDLPGKGRRTPGTVGRPQGIDLVILNDNGDILKPGQVGEVSIRGENVTKGYLNNPKANNESFTKGYFRTGDQGELSDDGILTLKGRIKELINRGGEKISPIELDGVMLNHPSVDEAVAFGADDEKYGQVVHAAIVLKKGAKMDEKEFQDWMKQQISSFKVPTKVYFTKELPKTATGKIQRRIISQVFANKSKL